MDGRLFRRGRGFLAALVVAGPLVGLAPSVTPAGAGAFPGINGVIACTSTRTGDGEVFTFNPTGTELQPTNLTNNPGVSDGRPRFSSDGRKIVFEKLGNLYIMDANGANVRQVTTAGGSAGSFSPGNDQLVFQSSRTGTFQVYKINVDGTNEVQLTFGAGESSLPQWSPDGLKIAFSSRTVDPSADVHIMNPDGTGGVDISNNPGVEDSSPTWSPDGTMIAFHSRRDDPTGEEIYRMKADGSNVVRLTFNTTPTDGTNFDAFPAWSPDGTRIVWTSGRDGDNFKAYTMSAVDGSGIIKVTNTAASDQRCDWQPLCTIYGSGAIYGTPGNDIICGSDGPDMILGLGGNDRIIANAGDDRVSGGDGNDTIFGGAGFDSLVGDNGDDVLHGNLGDDQLVGGAGNDRLYGWEGNDNLIGGPGTDLPDGGPGTDTCSATTMVSC